MKKTVQLSFEESFKRLEEVVARLDGGNLPLDETLALYEEGIMLARYCEQQLDQAEMKVTHLQAAQESLDAPTLEPNPQLF